MNQWDIKAQSNIVFNQNKQIYNREKTIHMCGSLHGFIDYFLKTIMTIGAVIFIVYLQSNQGSNALNDITNFDLIHIEKYGRQRIGASTVICYFLYLLTFLNQVRILRLKDRKDNLQKLEATQDKLFAISKMTPLTKPLEPK